MALSHNPIVFSNLVKSKPAWYVVTVCAKQNELSLPLKRVGDKQKKTVLSTEITNLFFCSTPVLKNPLKNCAHEFTADLNQQKFWNSASLFSHIHTPDLNQLFSLGSLNWLHSQLNYNHKRNHDTGFRGPLLSTLFFLLGVSRNPWSLTSVQIKSRRFTFQWYVHQYLTQLDSLHFLYINWIYRKTAKSLSCCSSKRLDTPTFFILYYPWIEQLPKTGKGENGKSRR